ncbi:MAG TPA: hypothetical protein VIS05_06530 [Ilumatobacter sp.]
MSVDTNTVNKNLAPYTRVRHPDFRILVSPVLSGMVSRMRIATRGRFVKNLVVELADERRPSPGESEVC